MAAESNLVAETLSQHLQMLTADQIKPTFCELLLRSLAKSDAVVDDAMANKIWAAGVSEIDFSTVGI